VQRCVIEKDGSNLLGLVKCIRRVMSSDLSCEQADMSHTSC